MNSDQIFAVAVYLLPALAGAIAIQSISHRVFVFSLLVLPGTVLHELAHFLIGAAFRARPVNVSFVPRKSADGYVLGSVGFANLTWYNAAPAALAPLLLFPAAVGIAYFRVAGGWHFSRDDLYFWGLMAPVIHAGWPSSTDWRLAAKSWPIAAGSLAVVVFLILFR